MPKPLHPLSAPEMTSFSFIVDNSATPATKDVTYRRGHAVPKSKLPNHHHHHDPTQPTLLRSASIPKRLCPTCNRTSPVEREHCVVVRTVHSPRSDEFTHLCETPLHRLATCGHTNQQGVAQDVSEAFLGTPSCSRAPGRALETQMPVTTKQ